MSPFGGDVWVKKGKGMSAFNRLLTAGVVQNAEVWVEQGRVVLVAMFRGS